MTLLDVITDTALEKFNHSDVYGDSKGKIIQKFAFSDEINRARMCLFAMNVIAARSYKPDVHVFDTTKHRSFNSDHEQDLILTGHQTEDPVCHGLT